MSDIKAKMVPIDVNTLYNYYPSMSISTYLWLSCFSDLFEMAKLEINKMIKGLAHIAV